VATERVVVDTDIIIDYLRRRERTLEHALGQFDCAITVITWYELNAVPAHSSRQFRLLASLAEIMEILPFNHPAADQAAKVWRHLRKQGQPIGLPDTLIAGICLANELPLLTNNTSHFQRVAGLVVISPRTIEG